MIGAYLAQDLWRRLRSGTDQYGQPIFLSPAATKGRWIEKRRLVRDAQGEQVISEVSVTLAPDDPTGVGDQLSADGVTYLTVIAVSVSRGMGGEAVLKRVYL